MSTIINIIIALLIFSVIVIVHELGHFLLAKRNGIGVTEFSLGMGPRLYSFDKGGTKYSLKLFPIGGSCMMGEDEDSQEDNAFNNKGVWQRISVIFAGPLFNFIFAFILGVIIISILGVDRPYVTNVEEGGAAAAAGLQPNDVITSINGTNISIGREVDTYFRFRPVTEETLNITYLRGDEELTAVVTPQFISTYLTGFNYDPSVSLPEVKSLVEGFPLEAAGVEVGDVITEVDGTPIKSGQELADYFKAHPLGKDPVNFTYTREDEVNTVTITPKVKEEYGIGMNYNLYKEKTNALGVLKYGVIEVKYWIVTTVKSLGKLVTGALSVNDIGGPVRIVGEISNTVEVAKESGLLYIVLNLLNWGILISANLGVMNLLPLPALDGGRLIFLFLEAIRGKPINRDKEGFVHMVGLIMLMALMVFVFFNDIRNLIG